MSDLRLVGGYLSRTIVSVLLHAFGAAGVTFLFDADRKSNRHRHDRYRAPRVS